MDTLTDDICRRFIIQEVDILDYLRALDGSVDGADEDISEVLDRKLEGVVEYRTSILDSLISNGQTMPISCFIGNWEWAGMPFGEGWWQGNGNHRLAAMLALGFETVLVAFSEHDFMQMDATSDSW